MSESLINDKMVELTEAGNKCEKDKTLCLAVPEEIDSNNEESLKLIPSPTEAKYDLSKFSLHRILNNNTRNKSIALLGNFPETSDNDKAIVIFEKQAFQENDVSTNSNAHNDKNGEEANGNVEHLMEKAVKTEEKGYFCTDLKVQTEFINNIYGSYQCTPPAKLSRIKATVVYPATEKHVEKYSISKKFLVNETPELYNNVTLPYITSSQFSLEWVYNILEHKQETERILYEDSDPENGFILLPDLKWDGQNVENLYLLAIIHKRDIKSIRDLDDSHLPLLRNIRTRTGEALESRYGILSNQLRMYFHYQPSFYHLHIHINPVRNEAPGIWCEKSHILDTVINNLELLPKYYQKATLPFVLYDGNKLLELYEDNKLRRKKAEKRSIVELKNEKEDDVVEETASKLAHKAVSN